MDTLSQQARRDQRKYCLETTNLETGDVFVAVVYQGRILGWSQEREDETISFKEASRLIKEAEGEENHSEIKLSLVPHLIRVQEPACWSLIADAGAITVGKDVAGFFVFKVQDKFYII